MSRPSVEPPLDPDGDRGRSLLREELADPDYYSDDLIERALTWLQRWLDTLVETASGADGLTAAVAIAVAFALLAALLLLLGRGRRTPRLPRSRRAAVPDDRVTAATWRTSAEEALAAGRYDDALVDGFRALAVRQVEGQHVPELPQATAHELAHVLGTRFPGEAGALAELADTFDAVHYGHHHASAGAAQAALHLDDRLAAVRR